MRFSRDEFQKKYPNLAKELEKDWDSEVGEEDSRSNARKVEAAEKAIYEPSVIDFLRRCETDEQGFEIIDYLRKRGEIDEEYAEKLKSRLTKKGIRSFGPKREKGCYESNGV